MVPPALQFGCTKVAVGESGKALMVRCKVTTLSQPFTFVNVCVGVAEALYDTPYHIKLTHTEAVVSPVLVVFGAATPEPASLTQPFTVCVTVYVPALLTLMDEAVSAVLHNNVPVAVVDKVDMPLQLFTTVTEGVAGGVPVTSHEQVELLKLAVW